MTSTRPEAFARLTVAQEQIHDARGLRTRLTESGGETTDDDREVLTLVSTFPLP